MSQNASAAKGGVVGWIREDQLPDTVVTALKQMEPGSLSAPIQSEDGFHILILKDKRLSGFDEENTNLLVLRAELTNEIGQQRLENAAKRYLTDLKASAFIERRV